MVSKDLWKSARNGSSLVLSASLRGNRQEHYGSNLLNADRPVARVNPAAPGP